MSFTRVVQDEIEYFTETKTGASGMSESGLSRVVDVSQQSIHNLIQNITTGLARSKCFKPFLGKDFILQAQVKINGKLITISVIPACLCAAIINYYAYISEYKTEIAYYSSLKFAEMGIEAWIQGITGWKPEIEAHKPTVADVEKYIIEHLQPGTLAAAIHPGKVVEMLQESGFSRDGYRIHLYLEMASLQEQTPTIETICQDLKISRSTFKKWLPEIQDWSNCADWIKLPTRQGPERQIQLRLHKELGGKMEAYTPMTYGRSSTIGPVDLVTKTEIIEIKRVEDWKTALGQVIAKAQTFPKHLKRIHLFGESSKQLKKITHHCQILDVVVTFETFVLGRDPVAA